MKRFAKWFVGLALIGALVVLLVIGCTPTTGSLLTAGKDVNRKEFQAEVKLIVADQKAMQERIVEGDADLDAQEARNAEAWQTALDVAGSAVNFAITGQATAASVGGLAIMGVFAGLWTAARRKAKNGDAVGGVVVQAVDGIRANPDMQKAFEAALKDALMKSGLSEAEYNKAIAKLKAENEAA